MPKDDGSAVDGVASRVSVAVDADCGEATVSTFGRIDAGLLTRLLPICRGKPSETPAKTTASPMTGAAANHQTDLSRESLPQSGHPSGARTLASMTAENGWTTGVASLSKTWADVRDFSSGGCGAGRAASLASFFLNASTLWIAISSDLESFRTSAKLSVLHCSFSLYRASS